jgi:glutamyl-Q tRNA(Asp) synthetase
MHYSDYRSALRKLERMELLYPCFCTRREIADEIAEAIAAPHGPEGPLYPGSCKRLLPADRARRKAEGESYALRLDVAKAIAVVGAALSFEETGHGPKGEKGHQKVQPDLFGDIVLARKDVPASYHLAVVVDDALQGVTLVTRGMDLFAATHVQRLLQAVLKLPTPDYFHHQLILDDHGRKFSKRDSAATLRGIRQSGGTPADVRLMSRYGLAGH